MERPEEMILYGLLYDEDYMREVYPHLHTEYFENKPDKVLFEKISNYIANYNDCPTPEAVVISMHDDQNIDQEVYENASEELANIKKVYSKEKKPSTQYMRDTTEKFCKETALFNAVRQSIKIVDGRDKNHSKEQMPQILEEALGVSFDSHVGHDYLRDKDERFDFYHDTIQRVSTGIDYFDHITKGGFPRKTLNVFLAGCVHPDTKVHLRVTKVDGNLASKIQGEYFISHVKDLLKNSNTKVEIESPDGFVPVSDYVDKGEWGEYLVVDENGNKVSVNENHLFQTPHGWKFAKDLSRRDYSLILKDDDKYHTVTVNDTDKTIPIVDIVVDHDNHRYYANGFSSHNTNVGKTLTMSALAGGNLMNGYNVLYISAEMEDKRIAERVDANLLNVELDHIPDIDRVQFDQRIQNRVSSKTNGRLIIKDYPTGAAHVGHIRHTLKELQQKENFKPDVIYIDYLGIMSSQRVKMGGSINSYMYVKFIAEEVRGLAKEFNVPIVSGAQVNRGGQSNQDVDLEDTAESFGLPQTADFMLSLVETDELAELNQFLCKQLKNRFRDKFKNRKFVIGVEKAKQRLYDVDESAQQSFFGDGSQDSASTGNDTPVFDQGSFGSGVGGERQLSKDIEWEI